MKHLGEVSVSRTTRAAGTFRSGPAGPDFADAKSDFLNAIWKAWSDYKVAATNEKRLG